MTKNSSLENFKILLQKLLHFNYRITLNGDFFRHAIISNDFLMFLQVFCEKNTGIVGIPLFKITIKNILVDCYTRKSSKSDK